MTGRRTKRIPIEKWNDDKDTDRFMKYVDKTDSCWLWTGKKINTGYGMFSIRHDFFLAHRISYELWVGPTDTELIVDHTCHNRGCVNPWHLRQISSKQNLENFSTLSSSNTTGYRGVCWDNTNKNYIAYANHHGKQVRVKERFTTAEAANEAALALRFELYTHNDLDRQDAA